jgi:hypothetical protein
MKEALVMGAKVEQTYTEAATLARRIAREEPAGGIGPWGVVGLQRVDDAGGWAVAVMQRREADSMRPDQWPAVVCVAGWDEWLKLRADRR